MDYEAFSQSPVGRLEPQAAVRPLTGEQLRFFAFIPDPLPSEPKPASSPLHPAPIWSEPSTTGRSGSMPMTTCPPSSRSRSRTTSLRPFTPSVTATAGLGAWSSCCS
jgi:hypothetical protein